jgi:hypothetical protein
MAVVKKKIWPEYFEEEYFGKVAGKKRIEIRLADFELKKGDTFILEEWDPKTKKFTGRSAEFKVKKIFKIPEDLIGFYPLRLIKKYGVYVIELVR